MNRRRGLEMDWGRITKRDLRWEEENQFSPDIDYNKEAEEYARICDRKDFEGRQSFIIKHNGIICFGAKLCYYRELKKKGLI